MKNQILKSQQGDKLKQTTNLRARGGLLIACLCASASLLLLVSQPTRALDQVSSDAEPATSKEAEAAASQQPANHRMEPAAGGQSKSAARHGRQYDGPLSASPTGNYAAITGDTGAYVGGAGSAAGLSSAGYGSAGASSGGMSSYASDPTLGMYSPAGVSGAYHDQLSLAGRGAGYGPLHGPYPQGAPFGAGSGGGGGGGNPLAAMFPSGGGLFSSSGGFPLMAKGFDVSEIVCTAIAVAIGAVIVGAPFILLYLFVMNQMQGGGGAGTAMGPGGGSISLTGPTSSTNVSGRKKRQTSLPEALFKQLSPLVDSEQVAQSFKLLMNAISKYQ